MSNEIERIGCISIKRQLVNLETTQEIRKNLQIIYNNNIEEWKPLEDEYNYYQYFDNEHKGTKVKKILKQMVLGLWGSHSSEQKKVIRLLKPLEAFVCNINGKTENLLSPPSEGYCSRFSFNCYHNNLGYISAHTDARWELEKSRVLLVLSKYSLRNNEGFWVHDGISRSHINQYDIKPGDAIIFNQSTTHGIDVMSLPCIAEDGEIDNSWENESSMVDCTFYHTLCSQY